MYYLYSNGLRMIVYKQVSKTEELFQILKLQQENLPKNLSEEEVGTEGFLTVEHTFEILQEMNTVCPHIIAVKNSKVIAYALCMHPKFAQSIEVLKPMFQEIVEAIQGKDNYMVMGQICVAKAHRGKGLFRNLYEAMKTYLPNTFDTIITEVDAKNQRSIRAHKAIGFKEIKRYFSGEKEWSLIYLK